MKRLFTLFLISGIILTGFQATAQDDEDKKRRRSSHTINDFKIDLGMNNYVTDGQFPDQTGELYTIKPFGSWYVALGSINSTKVLGPLWLDWGGDISWYNFKFQDPGVLVLRDPGQISFVQNPDSEVAPEKSKLVVSYINASMVPMFRFGHRKNSFRIGAGVYGGYRLGSYTKVKYNKNNQSFKDKDRGNYFVENLRYGVRFRLGFRDVDLFANYDLNNLFVAGRGPELNAFSVGVSIFDFD